MAIKMQDFLVIMMKHKMLMTNTTFKVDYNYITAIVVENQDFTNLLHVKFTYMRYI
jgi:hypothetical protein